MTLIEIVVVVTIIGLISGVTALAAPRISVLAPNDPGRVLSEARRHVLRDGAPQTVQLMIDGVAHEATVLPDGSVVTDSLVPLDQLNARWLHVH